MATYPVYPATTFTQAVELTIFASNQLHDVINGDALTTVETENGDVPTLRKALVDNFYFKTPIPWVEGESSTVFNQLYYFNGTVATSGWYYAPQATLDNPIAMGSTPLDDDNWRLYQTAIQSIPAQVYPWYTEITQTVTSVSPPYEFDTAIVILNGVVLTPTKDYTISDNKINFTLSITPESDAETPDILFCYIGKVEEGNPDLNYVTYNSLSAPTAADIIGTSSGKTIQEVFDAGASAVSLVQGGTVQDSIYWITLEMFGAKGDGVYDDAIAFQAAVNYAESINSSTLTRAPRVGIRFAAKKYYLKQTVKVTKGTVYWEGSGMYQTVFTPHPEANESSLQYKYFFDFSSPSWVSNATRTLHEVHLRNFTFLGDTGTTLRPVFYLGGVGWDCVFDTVHIYSAALSAIVADDLFDTQFYNLRINSCGKLHDPSNAEDIFTHPIIFRGKYDNCNAIRFIAPHFENNFTGVISITGRSNNIIFTGMPKFEQNSRGAASGAKYPVISINGPLIDSIKLDNIFVSHPENITEWFLESNSRHLSIRGGSYMSPSDLSGYTAKKWFRIHRDGWASATRCVGAVIDIDMMHVDGLGDTGVAPISIENDAVVNIKAPRVANPNRFIDILYDCQVTVDDLTVLGSITAANQTALFNVTGTSVKADIAVKQQQGAVTGLIYVNTDMTTESRRKSKIVLRSQNTQGGVGSLVSGSDTIGYDEGYVFQASGLVSSLGYCHTGKKMVVRCPDTANCLVTGGNIFLPGGPVTAACTITLMATNYSFRQGWTEISRVNGV